MESVRPAPRLLGLLRESGLRTDYNYDISEKLAILVQEKSHTLEIPKSNSVKIIEGAKCLLEPKLPEINQMRRILLNCIRKNIRLLLRVSASVPAVCSVSVVLPAPAAPPFPSAYWTSNAPFPSDASSPSDAFLPSDVSWTSAGCCYMAESCVWGGCCREMGCYNSGM